MRAFAGRGTIGLSLVVLCVAARARADLVNRAEVESERTALGVARLVYGHVATLSPQEGWLEKQWREMRARTVRLTRKTARGLRDFGLHGMSLRDGEFFLARLAERRRTGPESPETRPGTRGPTSATPGPAVRRLPDPDFDDGLAAYTEADILEAIEELPEGALAMVDAVTRFTDITLLITLNLRGILRGEMTVDWQTMQRAGTGLQDRREALKKKRKKASEKANIRTKRRVKVVERLARSAFKIVFGFALGLFLWMIVSRYQGGSRAPRD